MLSIISIKPFPISYIQKGEDKRSKTTPVSDYQNKLCLPVVFLSHFHSHPSLSSHSLVAAVRDCQHQKVNGKGFSATEHIPLTSPATRGLPNVLSEGQRCVPVGGFTTNPRSLASLNTPEERLPKAGQAFKPSSRAGLCPCETLCCWALLLRLEFSVSQSKQDLYPWPLSEREGHLLHVL